MQDQTSTYDSNALASFVDEAWDKSIIPALERYIEIPAKSPMFDADWEANGHMEEATQLIVTWCKARNIEGLHVEVVRLEGRTPLIFMVIPGQGSGTTLLYGHLDKQPEMAGWREDLGPWKAVQEGDRLYGRGGADDGYSAFASLVAIEALQDQGVPHGRCVVMIEACEESGSYDLPHYMEHLESRIGIPDLVICLDSGAGNFEQLWLTSSLRGNVSAHLDVEILSEGVHSGDAGALVPSSFRILRELLDRIQDSKTGEILCKSLNVAIPEVRKQQAWATAEVLGDNVHQRFPFVGGARAAFTDAAEAVLARTWRPSMAVTGCEGMPGIADAGNVLRPHTKVKLSFRLPPTANPDEVQAELVGLICRDAPYGARVTLDGVEGAAGWHAPPLSDWLEKSVQRASSTHFGKPAMQMGEGGTIPLMGLLGKSFPAAQFVITGVLGPGSNAHGPNEFLHVPLAKGLTACVSQILADQMVQGIC
ncbi:MAG: M20/M25/M40 family metallo-hydrolase [bacterium]|nr:M20/M25/M40 family metallo-hydrolase [bacterium]